MLKSRPTKQNMRYMRENSENLLVRVWWVILNSLDSYPTPFQLAIAVQVDLLSIRLSRRDDVDKRTLTNGFLQLVIGDMIDLATYD